MAPIFGAIFFAMMPLYLLAVLMGLCPYILPIRYYPAASFWLEWTAGLTMLVSVGITATIMLLRNGTNNLWRIKLPVLALIPALLGLTIAFQTLTGTIDNSSDSIMALPILMLCLLFIVGLHNTLDSSIKIHTFFYAYCGGLMCAQVVGLLAVLLEMNGIAVSWGEYQFREPGARIAGLFGQSNQLAVFSVLAWLGAVYVRPRLGIWTLFSLGVAITMAGANSRIGYLCLLLTILVCYLYQYRVVDEGDFKRRLHIGTFIHILVVVTWNLKGYLAANTISIAGRVLAGNYNDRLGIWADSLKLSFINPLGGVGFGDYAGARLLLLPGPLENPNTHHAHNIFLHLAAELGWPVAIVVSLTLLYIFVSGLRLLCKTINNFSSLVSMTMAMVLMIHSLAEHPIWYLNFLLLICIVFVMHSSQHLTVSVRVSKSSAGIFAGCYTIAAVIFCLVTFNYWSIQNAYMDIATRTQDGENAHLRYSDLKFMEVPEETAMRLSALPFFHKYSESLVARSLENDGAMADYKLPLLRRVMITDINDETVSRYLIFSISNGLDSEACKVARSAGRAADLRDAVLVRLQKAGAFNPKVANFLTQGCFTSFKE